MAVATVTAGFLEADVPAGVVPRSALYVTAEEAVENSDSVSHAPPESVGGEGEI